MLNKEELKNLLRKFNEKGYSDPDAKYIDNGKNGKVINLTIDNYTYEDEFYGGEPYCGNETIWDNGIDIFRSVYWGKFVEGVNLPVIYDFLKLALSKGPDGNLVHRGPKEFVEGNLKYTNSNEGDIEEFKLEEKIFKDGKEVYVAYFVGGRVNVQK